MSILWNLVKDFSSRIFSPAAGLAARAPISPRLAADAGAAYDRGDFEEAERVALRILSGQPDNFYALNLLGTIAIRAKRPDRAVEFLNRAVAVQPRDASVFNNLGIALGDLKRHDDALRSFETAIELDPGNSQPYNNLGELQLELKRHSAALESFEKAISIDPAHAELQFNLANALRELKRFEESLRHYDNALALRPDYPETFHNRGNVLDALRRYDEAIASYKQAIALEPGYAGPHFNMALCYLLQGKFACGWEAYEWRWSTEELKGAQRNFPQPLWQGQEPLEGKTILLHAEQGFGDTLQFCRYVPMVAARGAKVVLEVQPALEALLSSLEGVDRILGKGEALPPFELQCPLMSLPRAFGTVAETIPAPIPYLRPDPGRVEHWQGRLGAKRGLRVGLAWTATRLSEFGREKSVPLREFARILPGQVQAVSLQKDLDEEEAQIIRERQDIVHYGADFSDTAALIELMDVVVSVDTSIAHLAGAMGKPVWILTPYKSDWRWLDSVETSAWYPTARIFRQPAVGDWPSLMNRVREELRTHYPSTN